MSLSTCLTLVVAAIILFAGISFILKYSTDSTTIYADAMITALSLIAQWMMSKKYLQHWVLWIISVAVNAAFTLGAGKSNRKALKR